MQRLPALIRDTQPALLSTVLFSIADQVGALDEVLRTVRAHNVSMARIESRPSKTADWDYDFFVDVKHAEEAVVQALVAALQALPMVKNVVIVGVGNAPASASASAAANGTTATATAATSTTISPILATTASTPWFPRKKSDLDTFGDKVLGYGAELDADHPGFTDAAYRERRALITNNAKVHRQYVCVRVGEWWNC